MFLQVVVLLSFGPLSLSPHATLYHSLIILQEDLRKIFVGNLRFYYPYPFFFQIWNDYKLRWDPRQYDGIEFVRVPADKIWKPDIVLYNKYDDIFYPFY